MNSRNNANYRSERLVVRGNLMVVRPTKRHLFLMSLFVIIGLFIASFSFFSFKTDWIPVVFGGFFFLVGCSCFLNELHKPRPCLDLSQRLLYPKGLKHPELAVPLNTFCYLETLGKIVNVPGTKNRTQRFPCCELNIVLPDGTRHNILNHGDKSALLDDAHLLEKALSIRLREELRNSKADVAPLSPFVKRLYSILLLFFGLAFLASGGYTSWTMVLKRFYNWNVSRHWIHTPAVIVHSTLADRRLSFDKPACRIDIRYDYEVDRQLYHGTRYDFFRSDDFSTDGYASKSQAVADNPIGKATTCLVNPDHPEEAVLSRTIPLSNIPWFFFPIPFLAVGVLFLFSFAQMVHGLKKDRPHSSTFNREQRP